MHTFGYAPGNLSLPELLIIAVVVGAIASAMAGRGRGGALVLRKFDVLSQPGKPEEPVIVIEGRKEGLISFFLSVVGLDATTLLVVTRGNFSMSAGSLFGQITFNVPLTSIASTQCGFSKPIGLLIFAVLLMVGALFALFSGGDAGMAAAVVLALVSIGCMIGYSLKKKMALGVETNGGMHLGIAFKRSVIESVTVDIDKVRSVEALLREMVVASSRRPLPAPE
jgi:hypothetical protein